MTIIDRVKSIASMDYDRVKRLYDSVDRNPGAVVYAEAFPEHARGAWVYLINILPPLDPYFFMTSEADARPLMPTRVLTLAFTRDLNAANAHFLDGRVFSNIEIDTMLYAVERAVESVRGVQVPVRARLNGEGVVVTASGTAEVRDVQQAALRANKLPCNVHLNYRQDYQQDKPLDELVGTATSSAKKGENLIVKVTPLSAESITSPQPVSQAVLDVKIEALKREMSEACAMLLYDDQTQDPDQGMRTITRALEKEVARRDAVMVAWLERSQRSEGDNRAGVIVHQGQRFTIAEARAAWSRALAAKKAAREQRDAEAARRTSYWDPE